MVSSDRFRYDVDDGVGARLFSKEGERKNLAHKSARHLGARAHGVEFDDAKSLQQTLMIKEIWYLLLYGKVAAKNIFLKSL